MQGPCRVRLIRHAPTRVCFDGRSLLIDKRWTAVDRYVAELLIPADPVLEEALAASAEAGLPAINVSPPQGKLLNLLARLQAARHILELGTLGGYSTIWLARALPAEGRLISLERNPDWAELAATNLDRAGLSDLVEIRVGTALDSLPQLADEGRGPFDLIFIDADKENMASYYEWAVKLSRRGTLIIADNVVRDGAVVDADNSHPQIQGVRDFFERMAADTRVSATTIQTVGMKGYDGFALALVLDGAEN